MKRRISDSQGLNAVASWRAGERSRPTVATAVRWSLEELAATVPGRSVEVRVPPYGAVQILGGTTHRRGTPPAVVEMRADAWLGLVTGLQQWGYLVENGEVQASGERTELSAYFPLVPE
ncbi:sterol carrier family protein [Gleimia hominis]|uniref:Sterol carrier family protein n=1 Tax=Gleimia hominis TaxID=595468 RepID=A0ABU3I9E7_9ACTO|nr:sterol carrier family protein [Gleimia hominis]MDT3766988.1 sterol carrier family protein [Gleimia hominis]